MSADQKEQNVSNAAHFDWQQKVRVPEWVREMKEYYMRTGEFRPEDLKRLLGDPAKGVEMPVAGSISNHFCT